MWSQLFVIWSREIGSLKKENNEDYSMKWITHIALAFFVVKVTEIALMIDLLDSYWAYVIRLVCGSAGFRFHFRA